MNNICSWIYETLFSIFHPQYQEIFITLYQEGGYIKLGMIFIFIPFICWLLFYYLWRYPYGKIWHWLIWLLVSIIIVFGSTWGIANSAIFASNSLTLNQLLANSATGYAQYASTLPLKYALVNSVLALISGLFYSLIMKQFSKIQMHLPI